MFLRVLPKAIKCTRAIRSFQPITNQLVSLRSFSKDAKENKAEEKEKSEQTAQPVENAEAPKEEAAPKKEYQDEFTIKSAKLAALKSQKPNLSSNEEKPKEEAEKPEEQANGDASASAVPQEESKSESESTEVKKTERIMNVQLPPEEDVYGDLVYVLEYSDAVYIPEESKNKIYELYVEKHWDTKRISKTMKIAEDRVRAVIKLRDRHQKFIDQGRYNKKFVDIIEEMNQYENRQRGNKVNLSENVNLDKEERKDMLINDKQKLPNYIPRYVFINEEENEASVKSMIVEQLKNSQKSQKMVLKRKGIQLDRFNSTVNHKSKICLYDSSVGHNQFNNVILCENNERKVFDNQKDMNRSWNRYKYQHRNILEDVQLKETKDQPAVNEAN